MSRTRAIAHPAQTAGTLAIVFNGGLNVDGWTQHQKDTENYGYDNEANDGGAHWMAHGLRENCVEESLRLRIIGKAPRPIDEPALGYPDSKGQRSERNNGHYQTEDANAYWPAVINPHQSGHEQEAQETKTVDSARERGKCLGGAGVLEDHGEYE